jgi:probable phosphoglycerate mutase
MRLIFIRHAEPDYENDTLTAKGFREAEILSGRVSRWDVDRFYCSPLPRAALTAKPSLDKMGRSAVMCDWLKEFNYYVTDPTTGRVKVPWDFMPQYWTKEDLFYDHRSWYRHPLFDENPEYEQAVYNMREGLDGILAQYGYTRHEGYYLCDDEKVKDDDNTTVVFFAHLGANCEAMGYLLGISPLVLQQSTCLAPTSVSILNAEKRTPGAAMFRAQVIGSTSHLENAGEPLSRYAAFSDIHDL